MNFYCFLDVAQSMSASQPVKLRDSPLANAVLTGLVPGNASISIVPPQGSPQYGSPRLQGGPQTGPQGSLPTNFPGLKSPYGSKSKSESYGSFQSPQMMGSQQPQQSFQSPQMMGSQQPQQSFQSPQSLQVPGMIGTPQLQQPFQQPQQQPFQQPQQQPFQQPQQQPFQQPQQQPFQQPQQQFSATESPVESQPVIRTPSPTRIPLPSSLNQSGSPMGSQIQPNTLLPSPSLSPEISGTLSGNQIPTFSTSQIQQSPQMMGTPMLQSSVIPPSESLKSLVASTSPRVTSNLSQFLGVSSGSPLGSPSRDLKFRSPGQPSYSSLVSESSADSVLLNNGYTPISRIAVTEESGPKGKYIKAYNKNGQIVYVLLDTQGYVAVDVNDLTSIAATPVTSIPYSTKVGMMECSGMNCGVALECKEGVCTLRRSPTDGTSREETFITAEKRCPSSGLLNGDIVGYPIVKLSEIRSAPKDALIVADVVTKMIRSRGRKRCSKDLAEMKESLGKLNDELSSFVTLNESMTNELNGAITELEKYNMIYNSSPPTTEQGKEKYLDMLATLQDRNKLAEDQLGYCAAMNNLHKDLLELTRKIHDLTDSYRVTFVNVSRPMKHS